MESMETTRIEPRLMAILSGRMRAITQEMSNTLLRAGRSGILITARDLGCGISDAVPRLIMAADKAGLPGDIYPLSSMPRTVREIHGDNVQPGDCFLNNSPYYGAFHHADFSVCAPVFYKGEHLFYATAMAHMADAGAPQPSTFLPLAMTIYEEGLHLPCVRVQSDWKDIEDWIRMCKLKIRAPEQWYGDYLAMVGAVRIAERRLIELCDKYGAGLMKEFMEEWLDYGERRTIDEIRKLPKGTWEAQRRHDPVFLVSNEGMPVQVRITIDPDKAYLTVDYTDNVDCIPSGFNVPEAVARAIAVTGLLFMVDQTVPHNEGAFRRVKVKLRENCLIGGPRYPVGTSMGTTNCVDRLVNACFDIWSQIDETRGGADSGLGMPASCAVISGSDWRRNHAPYVDFVIVGFLGGGASYGHDGYLTYGIPVNTGMMLQDSLEMNEIRYPIIYDRYVIAQDSGGAGQWEGAPGSHVIYGPRHDPGVWMYANDGHCNPAAGARGGQPGGVSNVLKLDVRSGEEKELPQFSAEVIGPNERIVSLSCGGGGYGDPLDRDPEKVRWKAREGYISLEKARDVYGVVLDTGPELYAVDREATVSLRKELKAKKGEGR